MKGAEWQARRWIRAHFAEYIALTDLGFEAPAGVAELWSDECRKIAARLDPKRWGGK